MGVKTIDVYFAKFDKVAKHKKALGNTVTVRVSEVVFCAIEWEWLHSQRMQ